MKKNLTMGTFNQDAKVVEFLQPAVKLPKKSLEKSYPLYQRETPIENVSYDLVVFDTYDYMDQVISFSLSDTFIAAFKIYQEHVSDGRAEQVIDLFRYGTNNSKHKNHCCL